MVTMNNEKALVQKLVGAISYAIWQHEGGGTPAHNHWTGKCREAITEAKVYLAQEGKASEGVYRPLGELPIDNNPCVCGSKNFARCTFTNKPRDCYLKNTTSQQEARGE